MRLSRSESVGKKRKDQKFRNKFKGKKKHKRLDAICEKAYNRSHREVEPSDSDDGGDKLELRRSGRARKAPILLDSSPLPPKKRQKLDRSGVSSAEKVFKEEGVKRGRGSSSSKDLDGRNRGWRSRLRSGGKSARFSGRKRGEFSLRGKRKLFEDFDGVKEDLKTQDDDKKAGSVGEESTVVKSKRSGRVEASNVFENENQDVDLEGGEQDDKEKNGNDALEVIDEGDGSFSEMKSAGRSELGEEDVCITAKPGDRIAESEFLLEECHINGNVETGEENVGLQKLASDNVLDKKYAAKVDSAADQEKDEMHTDKHLEDETHKKSDEKYNAFTVVNHKPRLKLGRRCGLCGGGTDGKPPKVLVRDGNDSENEAYSGSSASEEPNYDVWDGFGNDSGWLGRLLGPINDRFGIAGIWVHQQCAVWSPEVYFAGLGCLKNVRAALYRGRVLKCGRCRRPGATIGCRVDRCPKTYHVPCARAKGCIFDHRKFLIACTDHRHLFQPHGLQNALRLKKLKSKKMKLDLRKMSNDASRKDIEAEEKWLENCGEDEEFLKRESKRLQRDLYRIAPVYIGGTSSGSESKFQGWDSVAGLQDVIQCMKEVVILPLLYPEFFNNLGLTPPRGVLLHGYPGTGKTLVVRALVGACARGDKRIAYFARKGADCLGKYVGDAERQLRLLFHVAEKSQPSIIFFDEIDGLAPCRTKQQDQTHSSVVSTLLALMDGLKSRGSVIVIGATNRPDAVDPALRRPGRFDREIYFPLPSVKDREAILSLHTQKWPKPITGSLLKWVAKQTIGFAGADLQALCTQAAMIALRRGFPLQEVLSAAETKMSDSRRPSIPTFSVEERDWLQAMSCVPPPCSQRDSGIAVNDVVAAPLNTFLVPCLLRPLTRLLVRLYLDECIWLPPPLTKASTLLKDVFVSALNNRRVQSDNWWSHVDSLLQEVNIMNEIEKNFLLANVLVGQVNLCSSNVPGEFHDESFKKVFPNSLNMGARSNLIKSISSASCNKSGFQMLISGEPKSGQRHLASCLLHCFVGNVDVWKIDLASLSHEGHGDMVHGLTRILMRSSSANLSMIYMPRIDLWAIETYSEAPEDNPELSSLELQSSGNMLCNGHYEINNGHEFCPRAEADVTESQTALKKASYLWTSFIEQVESMRVNTSLIILATSELPLSLFPLRVRQFFGGEIVGCSLSSPLDQKVPRFSVQLDGKLEPDEVISSFAMKLSRDLAQHFVQLIHGRNHIHENLPEEKAYNKVDSDDNRVCPSKSSPEGLLSPVAFANKTVKGKSSLLLAISTVGYQILCYPHFAELCWVTSKLKEGPFANVNGPLKGWPFNSCIVRPTSSVENVVSSGSGNIKSKESGVVRGLVAVGLSAYRGEYTSLRKVCLELRRVSEILVRQIDNKIQAGKDRTHFMHLLSQVSYLEDMVISWAHNLKSLEVDNPISEANINTYTGSAATDVCKDGVSEVDGHRVDATIHGSKGPEESPRKIDAKDVGHFDSSNCDNACGDAAHDVAVTVAAEPSQLADVEKHSSAPNEINLESSKEEASKDLTEEVGNVGSAKLSNGFTESCSGIQADGPRLPVDKHNFELFPSTEVSNNSTGSSSNNNFSCANASENLGGRDVDVDRASNPTSFTGSSFATCFYQCCSECYANLHSLLLKIINSEWGLKRGSSVEGVHDFVSSLSANLHLAVCKLLQTGNLSGPGWEEGNTYRKRFECRKCQETDMPECRKSEKSMMMECSCHTMSENSSRHEDFSEIYHGVEPRFIFKNGVLDALDAGTDVSYHCKFDKICLCFLIEWLARSKNIFD